MSRLPILMYHSLTAYENESEGLSIWVDRFEEQMTFLKKKGYDTLHLKDLHHGKTPVNFPKKAVILTFDDVYQNQLELALPVLMKLRLKATFFVPFNFVGATNAWDEGDKAIMSIEQLKSLDESIIELGWHSFRHGRYDEMSMEEIQNDLLKCQAFIDQNELKVFNALAYPYGKFPRRGEKYDQFMTCLKTNELIYGLRIGNRLNQIPIRNPYELQRIDIKGQDSLKMFKLKLRYGKLKLF